MSTRIRNVSIEKTEADDGDYFLGDENGSGVTYKITKQNLLSGIASGGNGGGLFTPKTVLIANYQSDLTDIKGHAYSTVGSPSIDATKSPYSGGSSLYLPGTSYIEYSANSDFVLNADWMVECFAWIPSAFSSNNAYAGILEVISSNLYIRLALFRSGTTFNGVARPLYSQVYSSGQSVSLTLGALNPTTFDAWNHISLVKNGNAVYFAINGVTQQVLGVSSQASFTSNPIVRVGYADGLSTLANGYIAGVRVRSSSVIMPTLPFEE